MEITLTVIFFLLGTSVGSFLNVCIDRLPAGRSLVRPPSRCDACQHNLSPKDLVPVFSYLWLRGRCRYCRTPVPLRSLWVELGSGLLFVYIYWHYGLSVEFAVTAFYCSLFVVLMVIDMEHKLILNKITYPAAVAALIISAFRPQLGIVEIALPWPIIANGITGMATSLIGGATGFIFFLIPFLVYPRGMGAGDVKMAGLIGLIMGFPLVLVALFIGIIIGGVAAVILLLFKIKKRKDAIPYGAFLALGSIATLLWGSNILNWYIGLL